MLRPFARVGRQSRQQVGLTLRHPIHDLADIIHCQLASPADHEADGGGRLAGFAQRDGPLHLQPLLPDPFRQKTLVLGLWRVLSRKTRKLVHLSVQPVEGAIIRLKEGLVPGDDIAALAGLSVLNQ